MLGTLVIGMAGCTDNATNLAFSIQQASAKLQYEPDGTQTTFPYRPKRHPSDVFTVIFLPEDPTSPEDLIEAGVSQALAERIFDELAYVDVGQHSMLIVHQHGAKLNFTSYWTRFAYVPRVLAASRQGEMQIVLEKTGDRVLVAAIQ